MLSEFEAAEGHKVSFRLQRDADGYPPADWEHLWAQKVADSLFRLDNTPFFVRGIAMDDIVATEDSEGMNVFARIVEPSRHSTLRVILFDINARESLRDELRKLGCPSELSHLPNLIAVDVPPMANLQRVLSVLAGGEHDRKWEYEEAALRHPAT